MISNTYDNILDNMLDKALQIQQSLSGRPEEFKDRLDYIQTVKHSKQREIYDHVMKKLETDSEENNNIKTKINTLISILDNVNKILDKTSQNSDEIVKVLNESRMSTLETLSNKALMGDNVTIPLEGPVAEVLKQQDLKVNPLGGKSRKSGKNKKNKKSRKGRKNRK
jgi:hypothetical protein